MIHVIEINSFCRKFADLIRGGQWRVQRPVTICRYFECLEVQFLVETPDAHGVRIRRCAAADILPRLKTTTLEFQVNVHVEGGAGDLEEPLSQRIAEFLIRECGVNAAAVSEFTRELDPEKIKILFLCEGSTLLIRIGD